MILADPIKDINTSFSDTPCHKQYEKDGNQDSYWSCAENLLQQADKELNKTYQRLMKNGFDGPHAKDSRNALKHSQRAWIKFRNADCDRIGVVARGISNVDVMFCNIYHTKLRTIQLNNY
ncbi:lysozyme inhibitor LprI family protein [Spartinivicinus poritis]|uniref:Lysozyme inhibitor LprI family protein n=1 Tax=Spartinivicinus poritis TaxID=2994640 RepID=A0ABT5UDR9_9GAMM|nr:lysozyme inhibitor LprI family protein [Spartinivicinus sp. A2-2]MDE1463244.1 lysozyme inhibitor LprI family protein [Spartinivicinus sp. A2-2]